VTAAVASSRLVLPLFPPKPVRAWASTELHKYLITNPDWIVEPKIDGDRCLVIFQDSGPELWSRHGKQFTNAYLESIKEQLRTYKLPTGTVLDGELVAGKAYQRLFLYDLASSQLTLGERHTELLKRCKKRFQIEVVGWMDKATAYEDALNAGHEGVVFKRLDSRYEWQRGTANNEVPTWVKMKP
jgi:ATP-dependent DNA ligase